MEKAGRFPAALMDALHRLASVLVGSKRTWRI